MWKGKKGHDAVKSPGGDRFTNGPEAILAFCWADRLHNGRPFGITLLPWTT